MHVSLRTWITFFLLAILMGLSSVYTTLLVGLDAGGSIVAVILCMLLLPRVDANVANYNLGQTMASAGASVGFTVATLASVHVWYQKQGMAWHPEPFALTIMVAGIALIGVTVAVVLRRHVVHWYFPSAVACATILRIVTSPDRAQRTRAMRLMGISGVVAAIGTLPSKVVLTEGSKALWSSIPVAKGKGLALSLDPLMYGIGLIVGPRIGLSLLLGALAQALWLAPWLTAMGTPPAAIGDHVRWTAVGLMTLPSLASVMLAVTRRAPQALPPGFDNLHVHAGLTRLQAWGVAGTFSVAMAGTLYAMDVVFGVAWPWVAGVILLGAPMVVALGRVAAETDINPIRLLAVVLLFTFSLFGTHSAVALLALGACGAAMAALAVDLFYDLRTGHLIQANPRRQILFQFLGIVPTAFFGVHFLNLLSGFGVGQGEAFPAPAAMVWVSMAEAFTASPASMPRSVVLALLASSALGILLVLLEGLPRTKAFTPSTFAMGVGLLLPLETCAAMALGGALRWGLSFSARRLRGAEAERQVSQDAFQVGAAIFAASALVGILSVLLISLGLLHLPAPG